MRNFDSVAGLGQALLDLFSDHHRAVLSTRATEADGQITLALADVVRNQVHQQVGDAVNELLGLGKRADIFRHLRMAAGQRAEFGNEVGIRK